MKSKNRVILVLFHLVAINFSFAQQVGIRHTGGPLGGVIGDIAITSSGDIYAGAYSYYTYSGLFKSTDAGESWQKIQSQFDDFEVYSLYVSKQNYIFVGTSYQGKIYRSTDNGQTWEEKNAGYQSGQCWAFGESKNGVLFAGDAKSKKIFRSFNNGENWELCGTIQALSFATNSQNVIFVGAFEGLFKTTDNGSTWTKIQTPFDTHIPCVLIDPNDNIYCGTGYHEHENDGNGVWRSTDGGLSWSQIGLQGQIVYSLAIDSKGNIYSGTSGNGVYKSANFGNTWINCSEGLYKKQVFRLKIDQKDRIFIGSETGGVYRSTNLGESFEQVGLPFPLWGAKNICFWADSLIFASTDLGVQMYNRNKNKWSNIGLIKTTAVSLSPSGILYASSDEGVFKSSNFGKNWIKIKNLKAYNVLAVNDNEIFVSDVSLSKSTDGGLTWISFSIETNEQTNALFANEAGIWASGIKNGIKSLYFSADKNNFVQILSDLNNSEQNSVFAHSNGYVLFTDPNKGTYRTFDNGQNWSQILSPRGIKTIYGNNEGLALCGVSNILWISNDYGNNWSSIALPLKNYSNINDIKPDKNNQLFLNVYQEGLFALDISTKVVSDNLENFDYSLWQNYPNPFNPITTIKFSLPRQDYVTIQVYDILGNLVSKLIDNELREKGINEIKFSANNLPSGIYIYIMTTGNFKESKKMILLK